ncbi:arylamine N-acetyltransferase family protein [Streptantibioticus cattleyicolor]|uniref:arylamine N-acetyltransferase family protein n=1 Tax=Streptantibioticus cattleyicolor TaxID=29303 RepID=UPI000213F2E1|nr:arylamine N-acetyltransferase [Streptantibioticus cattleyicolor]CCB71982.1 Arylamine N-acetyltransferase [Streptantibioticus cattleyicolor NRRL 8057 = DSM 46488]
MWNGERLDLDAYLDRLGYDGDRTPGLATLRALHRAHVLTLRWDNLDVILRGRVSLDLGDIQDKLVRRGRGGYCFEHVLLHAAALERLGFRFTGVQGRVLMGSDKIRPATHAMLVVEADGGRWLSDVGFGASPLEPLELVDGAGSEADGWRLLLREQEVTPGARGWALHQPGPDGGWMVRHTFTLDPQYPADYAMGNHFVATGDHSPFNRRPFLQRLFPDRLEQLDGRTLTTTRPHSPHPATVRELAPHEVPEVCRDVFGVELGRADAELVVARLRAADGGASAS